MIEEAELSSFVLQFPLTSHGIFLKHLKASALRQLSVDLLKGNYIVISVIIQKYEY
jgi:hypothetical protein